MDVVWDTGSDWLIVASEQCETCNGQKYDSSQDQSYVQVEQSDMTIQYGSGAARGYRSSASVCMEGEKQSCTDMDFILVEEQKGLDYISGIVGLSTGQSQYADGDLIIEELFRAGVIERPVFGFYLTGENR